MPPLAKKINAMLLAVLIGLGMLPVTTAIAQSLSDLSVDSLDADKSESDRNPFAFEKSGSKAASDAAALLLEGIVVSPSVKMTLLSGKLYREGDSVGSFKVKSIAPSQVILASEDGERIFTLDNYVPPLSESGSLYEIGFQNAAMKDALKMLAAAGGFNMITPDNLAGQVSLVFHQTTIQNALNSILRVNNLDSAEESQIIRIGKTDEFPAGSNFGTQQFNLKYATAKTLLDTVKSHLSEKGALTHDDRTNSLVIKDNQAALAHVAELILDLDKADTQVHIEAKIVDVSKNFSRAMGIQWGFSRTTGRVLGFGNPAVPGGAIVNMPAVAPSTGIGMAIGNIFNNTNLNIQLSAAETTGDAHIISQPSVTTVSNAPAKIRSGLKLYVKTLANPTTGETGIKEISTGIELTVTPQITSTNTITMKIDAIESEADFSRAVDGIPSVIDNTASTTVLVKNGETTVIGGLMKFKKSTTNNSTPYVSNVPVVGWLFKSKAKNRSDNELLIFITPRIIGSDIVKTDTAAIEQVSAILATAQLKPKLKSKPKLKNEPPALVEQTIIAKETKPRATTNKHQRP